MRGVPTILAAAAALLAAAPSRAASYAVDTGLWSTDYGPQSQEGDQIAPGVFAVPGWSTGGTGATNGTYPSGGNNSGTLFSDFATSGDFTYSLRMTAINGDDDNMGIVFGWQDNANHYRLGFEGGGFGDDEDKGFGSSDVRGLWVVREEGGVGTALYGAGPAYDGNGNLLAAPVTWVNGRAYDVSVTRSGASFSVVVHDTVSGLDLLNQSFADSTFMGGRVGVYTESQMATFDSIAVTTPAPEPGEWAMIAAGMGVVGAAASRRRRT